MMSNSKLVSYTKLSPNHSGKRTHSIDRITPHCLPGQLTLATVGSIFAKKSKQASANYAIGRDGKIGLYVAECNRSWCSSSPKNDQRAVTIECASELESPYEFNTKVWKSLVKLCTDICERNGKTKLLWLGTKSKTLTYSPKSNEMVLTVHRWFANKTCPGDWMMKHMDELAEEVTKNLGDDSQEVTKNLEDDSQEVPFTVTIKKETKIKKSASAKSATVDTISSGVYTIVEVVNDYGKLKSGLGYIKL